MSPYEKVGDKTFLGCETRDYDIFLDLTLVVNHLLDLTFVVSHESTWRENKHNLVTVGSYQPIK